MAAEIKQALRGRVSDVRLIPSGGGVFEVRDGQSLVFSKRASGRFPHEGEIVSKLRASG
ncbi:MAG: Rdx family protein [Chloroflexota bacterium]|nr:Rdx family protein [Chloroflexota bacterium]